MPREQRIEQVAIERPDGLLVDRLLEAGLVVIAIHPNQVKAARGRYTNAGGKSDRFEAFVLAELARTDSHRFRPLQGDSDQTKSLRALTMRAHQDAVWTRVALANQLRAELDRVWPGATQIFAAIDSPIALAFLTRYPRPTDARRLTHRTLAALLRRHRYSGRRSPDELLKRLRSAPTGAAGTAEHTARRTIVLGLIAALQGLSHQSAGANRRESPRHRKGVLRTSETSSRRIGRGETGLQIVAETMRQSPTTAALPPGFRR